jgi:hypothetical protein
MAARTETFPLSFLFPRRIAFAVLTSAVTSVLAELRDRMRRPALPRMSDEWLTEYERRSSGRID